MILLPIVSRELRVTSRRPSTYWTRFTAAFLGIAIGAIVWGLLFRQSPGSTGLALFVSLAVIAYIYAFLSGAIGTADSVSEEKREGTLGLLFLTDLKSYDIVAGKITASSVNALYGLLAIFPIMAVPLLLGGVAPAEFGRVLLVCLNTVFLSLALGILCSTICRDERKAIGLTVLVLVLLTVGWPALVLWTIEALREIGHPLYQRFRDWPEPLLVPSPILTCVLAFDDAYKTRVLAAKQNWFYISLGVTHAFGWLLLALTTFILPHVWQDRPALPATTRLARWRDWWRNLGEGSPGQRLEFRRRLLSINPFYWLASRDRFKFTLVWIYFGAGAVMWLIGLAEHRRDWLDLGTYIFTAVAAHTFLKWWIAIEASRRFAADRRSGALELLLSTPLKVEEILRGQWSALLRQFGLIAAIVGGVDLIFLILGLDKTYDDAGLWVGVCLSGMVVFVADMIALPVVSMWLALQGRKGAQAGVSAIVLVCVVPWFIFGAFGALAVILEEVFRFRLFNFNSAADGPATFLILWVLLSLAIDGLLVTWALRNLRHRFRIVATERRRAGAGFWGRFFRAGTGPEKPRP